MTLTDELIVEMKKYGILRLANDSGISYNSVAGWSRKEHSPTLANVEKILDVLGLEMCIFPKE